MNSVTIFSGFKTIKFFAEVTAKYTFTRKGGVEVLGGIVTHEGVTYHVEWVGNNEWWGRTT